MYVRPDLPSPAISHLSRRSRRAPSEACALYAYSPILRLEAVLFPSFLYTCYFLYKWSSIYLIMYSHDFSMTSVHPYCMYDASALFECVETVFWRKWFIRE